MEHITQNELDRFNKCWETVSGCKLWNKFLDRDGYGSFYFRKKLRRAHRVSYYIKNGDIQKGMVVDHICKNRSCVEPSHLRAVTRRENSIFNSNSVGAINSKKTHCPYGHSLDRKYGNQRYCSICQAEKSKRLRKKWAEEANKILC